MSPLSATDVTVAHGDHDVLHELSVAFPAGAVTALVGPNGSGKSTLLRATADLHRPTAGAVLLDGRAVTSLRPRELARELSFLPQAPLVPDGLSVAELVAFGRYPHRGPFGRTTAEDQEACRWALDVTATASLADRAVGTLSGGERQRAWVAVALAQRTRLLLLDEPTTYLDVRYQVEILDLVRDLVDRHGLTVVLVLHDLNQAAAYADRMVLLRDGRIVGEGTPSQVLTREAVATVFGLDVDVEPDPVTGTPTCQFYRRRVPACG